VGQFTATAWIPVAARSNGRNEKFVVQQAAGRWSAADVMTCE